MSKTKTPLGYTNNVKGSVHNLSLVKTTTMHPGFIYPIYSRKVLAGDRVSLDMNAVLKSNPLIAQLFSSFKLKIAIFFDSDSNYYGFMDNNQRKSVQDLINLKRFSLNVKSFSGLERISIPQTLTDAKDRLIDRNRGVGHMSLMDFAGIPVGSGPTPVSSTGGDHVFPEIDLGFVLSYINIVRTYYANQQQDFIPWCGGVDYASGAINGSTHFLTTSLSSLEYLPMLFRLQPNGFSATWKSGSVPGATSLVDPPVSVTGDSNYSSAWKWFGEYISTCFSPSGGLFLDTFLPDQWTNILNRSNSNVASKVSVTDSSFSIDTFRFQNKLQAWLDRLTVSGGRFSNWLRTVWGVKTSKNLDIPELMAVHQSYVNPQPVVATSSFASGDDSIDLGQQGGSFNSSTGVRRCTFKASTPGRVMILVSLIPCVEYCQGIDPELVQTSFSDEYNPELSNLGFQPVPQMFYSMFPGRVTGGIVQNYNGFNYMNNSVGKQVAWLNYMTDVNRCHGEFSNGGIYDYWVLQRRYTHFGDDALPTDSGGLSPTNMEHWFQFTQYINPFDYQYPFNFRSLIDPNWQFQLGIRAKWYRPIGKSYMPTIGR